MPGTTVDRTWLAENITPKIILFKEENDKVNDYKNFVLAVIYTLNMANE